MGQFCSNIVSETSHLPEVRNLLVKRISNELPEFCNQKTLGISSKIIRIAKRTAEQEISSARRVMKLAAYKEILMDYFNEILPVKSGQKDRLQYFTDKELFFKIQQFLLENHQLQVSRTSIRKFVKKETKRSHVSKCDSCPYCHQLRFSPEQLSEHQKIGYENHKKIAQDQQDFKWYILQALKDDSIPNGVVVTMDFSKFECSAKCESLECHILVLRYGKTLAEKVEHQTGVSKMINGLHRAYINIFAESSRDKHDPDFVFLSWDLWISFSGTDVAAHHETSKDK